MTPENIKHITDQLFTFFDTIYVPGIIEKFSCAEYLAEQEAIKKQKLTPQEMSRLLNELQLQQNEQTVVYARALLAPFLQNLLPGTAIWYKDSKMPVTDLFWVVNPFTYIIMAPITISVALQQKDDLLLGILVMADSASVQMITGEKGSGSWNEQTEYKVNNNYMSAQVQGMQVIDALFDMPKNDKTILQAFRRTWEFPSLINRLPQNASKFMCDVAAGFADFTLGIGVSYHDIAAAVCIVQQAGGIVIDFQGGTNGLYNGASYIACNKNIHQQFMEVASNQQE